MAPITPSQISSTVPSASSALCDKFKKVLLELPALLSDFFTWMLKSDGSLSDAFKAEIIADAFQPGDFKGSFSSVLTTGWLRCEGQLLKRSDYPALFSAIGTTWGAGDGSTTFQLPDQRDRVILGASATRPLGWTGGEETHLLTIAEMPSHQHTAQPQTLGVSPPFPAEVVGLTAGGSFAPGVGRSAQLSGGTGGTQAHNNMQPSIAAYLLIKT